MVSRIRQFRDCDTLTNKKWAAVVPHPVDTHVGRQLSALRKLRGLPQTELARQMSMSFQQIQKYESGDTRISTSKMWQLCQALDVEPGYFFEGLEGKKRNHSGTSLDEPQDGPGARQTLVLNQAFQAIDDMRIRRQIVHFVKLLAHS